MAYKWPPHGRPSPQDRAIWKEAILTCLSYGIQMASLILYLVRGTLLARISANGDITPPKTESTKMQCIIWMMDIFLPMLQQDHRHRRYIRDEWVRDEEIEEAHYTIPTGILSSLMIIVVSMWTLPHCRQWYTIGWISKPHLKTSGITRIWVVDCINHLPCSPTHHRSIHTVYLSMLGKRWLNGWRRVNLRFCDVCWRGYWPIWGR